MVAPTLSNYQYQFSDTGFLLNGPSSLPFVDVDRVEGLGQTPFQVHADEVDGQHGGVFNVQFALSRTIIIDGMLYADPSSIETTLDVLNKNYLPNDTEYPFYFKQPGVAQRYVIAKSLGIKYDEETLRRTGQCKIQIQLGAGKPEKRVDNATVQRTIFPASNVSAPNTGNTPSFAKITVVGGWKKITFGWTTTSESLAIDLATNAVGGDVIVIDFRTKTIKKNGINITGQATLTGTWWDIHAETAGSISMSINTGGPPTSITVESYSAWL